MENYKQKYEAVLNKVKDYFEGKTKLYSNVDETLKYLFPELKESEDEKIRKEILEYFQQFDNAKLCGVKISDWIAWLEKQGKNEEINEASYRAGIKRVLDNPESYGLEKQCEQKPNDKIIERANTAKQRVIITESDGDANIDWDCRSLDDVRQLLKCGIEYINNLEKEKQILPNSRFGGCPVYIPMRYDKIHMDEQKPIDKVEPKFHEGDIIIHKELGGDYIHNSHKIIQVDILDKKYRLEGGLVAHFSEQDDYELVEQKPAWSEEDERKITGILMVLESWDSYHVSSAGFPSLIPEYISWLKFLKERIKGGE